MTARKQDTISAAIAELTRAFDELRPLFIGVKKSEPRPLILIQTTGRKSAYGWMAPNHWRNGKKKTLHEITITAEYLNRGTADIGETMLHEMAHWANLVQGIKDCSKGQYHNAKFKAAAEAVGLIVTKHRSRGWATTELGPEGKRHIRKLKLKKSAFAFARRQFHGAKAPTRMKKWTCGCTIVRCATELNAVCGTCTEYFERA